MCRRIQCERCKKPTFAGCGKHVDQVLRNVPEDARCHCRELDAAAAQQAPASQPLSPAA